MTEILDVLQNIADHLRENGGNGLLIRIALVAGVLCFVSGYNSSAQDISLNEGNSLTLKRFKASDDDIEKFYQEIKKSKYSSIYENFLLEKESLKLDDWIYYKFIGHFVENNFPGQDQNFKALFCWYILNKSGYDIRIDNFNHQQILLYAFSHDKVYTPMFKKNGVPYICLNCRDLSARVINECMFIIPNSKPKLFSFYITRYPDIPSPDVAEFELGYKSDILKKFVLYRVKTNATFMRFMEDFPNVEMNKVFNTPLSAEAYNSLMPQLKAYMEGMDQIGQVAFLLEFVRKAFIYMDDRDKNSFGKDKWATPEQVLYYPYSDCEDLSGLFYYLVKEIVKVPVIVILYPKNKHVNVGINLPGFADREALSYKEMKYFVSETTSEGEPFGENKLYHKWEYRIIEEYNPGN